MLGVLGQVLISIASFLLVLTFIVTIHELGHFLVARAFGVKIDRFAIGFGRAVFRRVDRKGVRPMSFGGGIHFCLGAQLARVEALDDHPAARAHVPTRGDHPQQAGNARSATARAQPAGRPPPP